MVEKEKDLSKAKGGNARAEKLTAEQRSLIAKSGALARWNKSGDDLPQAINEGTLELGAELDCFVLKDRRRIFNKRNMADAIGLKSQGGNVFLRTINSNSIGSLIPEDLRYRLNNPIVFKTKHGSIAHGYEGTDLIDVCDAIWEARKQKKLTVRQHLIGVQAEIILRSAAKVGIIALIDEATGYAKDKGKDEYRELFKELVREIQPAQVQTL
jgi:hypothetical protein